MPEQGAISPSRKNEEEEEEEEEDTQLVISTAKEHSLTSHNRCVKRIFAWRHSARGCQLLLGDPSMQALGLFSVVVLLSCFHKLSAHWYHITLAILLSFALEAINSTVELLCDYIQPHQCEHIKDIKDMASAMASIGPIIIGCTLINVLS